MAKRGRPRKFKPPSNRSQGGLEISTTYIPDDAFFSLVGKALAVAVRSNAIQIQRLAKALVPKRKGSSKPGDLFHSHTGNYRSSIQYRIFKNKRGAFIGPTWPKGAHAGMLKYGTKKMGARLVPSVVALDRFRSRIVNSYKDKL